MLVVDDFHLTDGAGLPLALLLEYRPPSLQLVVATRADPPLRLHRMRANNELVELRDEDLALSAEETRAFLAGFGVRLGERDLAAVHRRSEGWVAGLQMAAISIKQSPDPLSAAARVGLHRHTVAGYFLDEVLYPQAPDVVDFMLATSVLDELSVPACTALCGQMSAALLRFVYNAHLFVTVADEEAGSYRYHQLVKEVLQAELHARDPARQQQLHLTAAPIWPTPATPARRRGTCSPPVTPPPLFTSSASGSCTTSLSTQLSAAPSTWTRCNPTPSPGRPRSGPLAVELLTRGAFERGARAFTLAQDSVIDAGPQPELAMKLALVSSHYCALVGQLDESLAHRDRARSLAAQVGGLDDWRLGLDVLAMYCYTYLGQYAQARETIDAVAWLSSALRR